MTPAEELIALQRLADGTVKQVNPFTGTQVWTVPGRANRPLPLTHQDPHPVDPDSRDLCAFCPDRYAETTPERERVVLQDGEFCQLTEVTAATMFDTTAEFRVIPNLFEIVSWDYWVANHGLQPTPAQVQRRERYLAEPEGRQHVLSLMHTRDRAAGLTERPAQECWADSMRFFAGCHDVVISRRHLVDGATTDDQLSFSGSLTPQEHEQYVLMTVRTIERLYRDNPSAVLVQAFQNWLKPAGASFDHLHKQLVAVDELGTDLRAQLERLEAEPDLYQRWGPEYAAQQGLVIAANEHAVAFAGIGHRFPAIEVWCTELGHPWELSSAALRDWSELLRRVHHAIGPEVPTNEEWHHQPPSLSWASPLRAVIKLRINTPAGFEGGTRIYVNTIDPWSLKSRLAPAIAPD